jgi:hypothetical protein
MVTSQEGQKNEDTRTAPHTPTNFLKKWLVKALVRGPYKNKGAIWGRIEHSHSSALVLTNILPKGLRVSLKVYYTTKLK